MPDYREVAEGAGWRKEGKKWTHPNFPGVTYWSEVELYQKEDLPGKRPCSIDWREPPKPVEVLKQQEISNVPEGQERKPSRPAKGL